VRVGVERGVSLARHRDVGTQHLKTTPTASEKRGWGTVGSVCPAKVQGPHTPSGRGRLDFLKSPRSNPPLREGQLDFLKSPRSNGGGPLSRGGVQSDPRMKQRDCRMVGGGMRVVGKGAGLL